MIALLLMAQIAATPVPNPAPLDQTPPVGAVSGPKALRLLQGRTSPSSCAANTGRLEASLAEPTALYRKGDRPAKGLRRWADFPEATICLIGSGQ